MTQAKKSNLTFTQCKELIKTVKQSRGASKFVLSCDNYLNTKGFLTVNQVKALKKKPSPRYEWDDYDNDEDDFYGYGSTFDFDPFDP